MSAGARSASRSTAVSTEAKGCCCDGQLGHGETPDTAGSASSESVGRHSILRGGDRDHRRTVWGGQSLIVRLIIDGKNWYHTAMATADETVRRTLATHPGRLFGVKDLRAIAPSTAMHALGRLVHAGEVRKAAPGLYYFPEESRFGELRPEPSRLISHTLGVKTLHLAGHSAANGLGFSTQVPAVLEIAVPSGRRVRRASMRGVRVLVRSYARRGLSPTDGAFLEVLRDLDRLSELEPNDTVELVLELVTSGRVDLRAIARSASDEPARVRAMLGAIADHCGGFTTECTILRRGLNLVTRYDFGALSLLAEARSWGARDAARNR